MSDNDSYPYRRPRMDPEAHRRIMTEIARLGRPDPAEITTATSALRDILLDPIEDNVSDDVLLPAAADITNALKPVDDWSLLEHLQLKSSVLDKNLVITANRSDPAHASFDVLRTRLVQALADNDWTRVAITSPTAGCGKSFTALNLAMTLSRYDNRRTVLMDLDFRHPSLARSLGQKKVGSLGDMLRGDIDPTNHIKRIDPEGLGIGPNLAVGLNDTIEPYAAELLQTPLAQKIITGIEDDLAPDVMLYDLPPALAQDDVISLKPYFDCVLLVVGGGISTADEIKEVHRRIGDDKPVIGVVLNMAEDGDTDTY